jgi:hypothetical protein
LIIRHICSDLIPTARLIVPPPNPHGFSRQGELPPPKDAGLGLPEGGQAAGKIPLKAERSAKKLAAAKKKCPPEKSSAGKSHLTPSTGK